VVGPVGPGGSLNQNGIYIIQYQPGAEFYPWTSTSGNRAVWMRIIGHSGGGSVRISAVQSGAGTFDLYGDVLGPNLTSIVSFNDHLVQGHLADYASTNSAIVVADYVVRTSYVDIDGIPRDLSNEGAVGQLWYRSSEGGRGPGYSGEGQSNVPGPRLDLAVRGQNLFTSSGKDGSSEVLAQNNGRSPQVDVAASGQNLFTSSAQNSYWHSLRFNLNQPGGGWYVRFGGTSGSAPIVVGTVALMLQAQPSLTADQVRQVLHSTAVSDSVTGVTPNARWGYGKLNLLAALDALLRPPQLAKLSRRQ
jgi:subtilisin family serine protease